MNKKILANYRANKRLIERNSKKVDEEKMKDIPVVMGHVKGSSPGFPYIEQHFSVQMDEPAETDRRMKKIASWNAESRQAQREMEEVEQFIEDLSDIKEREIFTYRYIDGMKLADIGELVGYTHGRVSQIISRYLKD